MTAENILKVREDSKPIRFKQNGEDGFRVTSDNRSSWFGENLGVPDLRKRIEPWLSSLFQSEHLSLLAGSGLTHAVHHLAVGKSATGMNTPKFKTCGDKISKAAKESAERMSRNGENLEDALRVANELLRGLEILDHDRTDDLRLEIDTTINEFAQSILTSERGIATAAGEKREQAFNVLVSFLMSFAGRGGPRERLHIFTTNYDRLIEAGAELAGMHLLDRFVGTLAPVFRSSRLDLDMHYNPPGIRGEPRFLEGVAHFTKLHGSVDWVTTGEDIRRVGLPFGAESLEPYLEAPGLNGASAFQLMIYPNSSKDRETAGYPYVEMFRDLAGALCRPNSTLVTYGYSFGDDHINRVLRDMLTIPSTHVVIISHDDASNRIIKFYENIGRSAQMSLLVGPDLADLAKLTQNYLPKPAIDRTTFRMAELLRQRFGTEEPSAEKGREGAGPGDES